MRCVPCSTAREASRPAIDDEKAWSESFACLVSWRNAPERTHVDLVSVARSLSQVMLRLCVVRTVYNPPSRSADTPPAETHRELAAHIPSFAWAASESKSASLVGEAVRPGLSPQP